MTLYIFNEAMLLLGGITVFLLGLMRISENMQGLAVDKTRKLLQRCASNPVYGLLTGAAVTAVAQSSIAINVVTVGFVESEVLSFYNAAAIIMGANIGTTVTAQIVSLSGSSAFDVTAIGSLIAFGGLILSLTSKKKVLKSVGGVMIGFGLIFIGLEIMGESVGCFKGFEWFRNIFLIDNALVLVLNGIVITGIMQSSSAVTGVMIVLAANGLLTFENSVFIILGANVGTCFPVILSSLNKGEAARRTAYFNLFFNILGAALFFFPMLIFGRQISAFFTKGRSMGRAIADFHTAFNVIVSAIVLPFLRPFTNLVAKVVKDERKSDKKCSERQTFAFK